jgi:hypothetical protein
MILAKLAIRRKDTWEDKERSLVGSVWFEGENGEEIKINIDEVSATAIVALCAKGIVDASTQVATLMVQDVMRSTAPALGHKQ